MWQKIYEQLKAHGFDVFSIGQHKGDCIKPYIVVNTAGSSQLGNYSSDVEYYDLMIYVPQDKYSTVDAEFERLKAVMRGLYPELRETHYVTPDYCDSTNHSVMRSIQYKTYRKHVSLFAKSKE